MGHISFYNLGGIKARHNTTIFVETGIGDGDGIKHAAQFGFDKYISIEIMEAQCIKMREALKDIPNLEIIHGHTLDVLPKLLETLEGNVMFWLDAHFPGADIGMAKHDDEKDDLKRLPLEEELFLIKKLRKGKDVILFDDLALYKEQGKHAWREDLKPRHKFSSDTFYADILTETHDFASSAADTGYAVLTPKQ